MISLQPEHARLPAVREALNALADLRAAVSADVYERVCTVALAKAVREAFMHTYDLAPWKAVHRCTTTLLGNPCRDPHCPGRGAVSAGFGGGHLHLDHLEGFRGRATGKPAVIVAHNYGHTPASDAALRAYAAAHGLKLTVSPASWYWPTGTFRVCLWTPSAFGLLSAAPREDAPR